MSSEKRLRRDNRLPFQEIQGEAVIVVPARRELHQLDEVGTFVWNALREARSMGNLVAAVVEEFEVTEERADADVRAFIAELEDKGLVVRA